MLKPIFRVWNKGVTLVEMLVVLSIISFVLVGSLVLFGVVGEKQKVTTMTSNLAIISSAITSFYSTSADYNGLSADTLIKAGGLPTNIIQTPAGGGAQTLADTYGAITVGPTNKDGGTGAVTHYQIIYESVPSSACTPFVANAYNSYIKVYVGTTPGTGDNINTNGLAASECAGGLQTINFVNK